MNTDKSYFSTKYPTNNTMIPHSDGWFASEVLCHPEDLDRTLAARGLGETTKISPAWKTPAVYVAPTTKSHMGPSLQEKIEAEGCSDAVLLQASQVGWLAVKSGVACATDILGPTGLMAGLMAHRLWPDDVLTPSLASLADMAAQIEAAIPGYSCGAKSRREYQS